MIRYNTIQELIDGGYDLHAHCQLELPTYQKLDLLKLRERLGPDHSVMHDYLARRN